MSSISNQALSCNINKSKIRVAIITDVVNWAFANIAFNLANLSQDQVEYVIIPANDPFSFNGNILHVLLAARDCDVLHFMWRGILFWYIDDLYILLQDIYRTHFNNNKIISTAVYDHHHLPNEYPDIYDIFCSQIKKNYYVCNKRLFDIYSNIEGIYPPRSICTDGVDLDLFYPRNPFRYDLQHLKNRMITIGWAGNSYWGGQGDDHKGLQTIIKPTIERLAREGYAIKIEIADRNIIWREQHDMPDFIIILLIFMSVLHYMKEHLIQY